MKIKDLQGLTLWMRNPEENNEVYVAIDDAMLTNIKDITTALIGGGQVFIRLADHINMEFDEKVIGSTTQNCETEILVILNHRNIDFDTMATISRKMPQNYTLTGIHMDEITGEYGSCGTFLFLVYKKAN